MKKVTMVLVVVLVVFSLVTTALAGVRKITSESLELTIYDNDGVSLTSGEDNGAAITFDLDNIKPGETRIIEWTARNIGEIKGIINYLRIAATQNGGVHAAPEMGVDPDNSGDLGALLIGTLSYQGNDYIIPMDKVLSPEGMVYNPAIILKSGDSTEFKLRVYWPDHSDDNLGQGDVMETKIDIKMTPLE